MTDADLVAKKLAFIETSEPLRRMVGFRNLLVHGYAAVDPRIVREIVDEHLDDLRRFVAEVRSRLDTTT